MDALVDEWIDGCIGGRMMDGRMDGLVGRWLDGWIGWGLDGWMDWMVDGWMGLPVISGQLGYSDKGPKPIWLPGSRYM